jgi:hypothetical protein
LNEEASVIAVDEVQYINQIFITGGEWCQADFAIGFSPVDLQSSERGLGDALLSIEDLEMVGREEIDGGIGVYHLKGSVETERVRSVSVGMISSAEGNSDIDIYIRQDETNRLARIIVKEIVSEDETRLWTIDFVGYNQPYSVDEPQELLESCLIS